jgi:hypothetical protein
VKGLDIAKSDVDLLVIGETLTYAGLFAALEPPFTRLKRTISPTLYSRVEIDKRIRDGNSVKHALHDPCYGLSERIVETGWLGGRPKKARVADVVV